MSEKKLGNEELSKVSGGAGDSGIINHLSGPISTSESYDHQGENLFFYSDDYSLYYCKLIRCYEDYGLLNLWSWTKYDVEIIEGTSTNLKYWGKGCHQTLHSSFYRIYKNYNGERPIRSKTAI